MAGTPKLIILSEQLRGQRFELIEDLYTCGRVEGRDICIVDPTISTHHCDFIKQEGSYLLIDKGSTNGTRVVADRKRVRKSHSWMSCTVSWWNCALCCCPA